jgi:hypothetical protein
MTRLLGIAVSAVLLLGTTQFAEAAYPCAEGFTLQDGFCKPYRGPYEGYGYRYAPYGYGYRYAPYYRYGWQPYYRQRHCWWRHGRRYCR